jgi:hypothetical protein
MLKATVCYCMWKAYIDESPSPGSPVASSREEATSSRKEQGADTPTRPLCKATSAQMNKCI